MLVLFCFLLDVVSRAGIIAEIDNSRKSIQAVSDSDVEGFAKYSIALARVCNDLGVSARDIEDYGVLCTSNIATHFNILVVQSVSRQ